MIKVPKNTIVALPYDDFYRGRQDEIYFSLKGQHKRDWFSKHAYLCLPLVIGNQYGFAMKSLLDATLLWNGGPEPQDTTVTIHNTEAAQKHGSLQLMNSHFGLGIVTVQTAFALRTPPSINLMTFQPPNWFIDGLQNMTGVVETDNLRRDFTFNMKLTRANHLVKIKVGDVLGAVLPYPRDYVDHFELKDAYHVFSAEEISTEQKAAHDFGVERSTQDPKKKRGVGRRYFEGEDVYGTKFTQPHQKTLKNKTAKPIKN